MLISSNRDVLLNPNTRGRNSAQKSPLGVFVDGAEAQWDDKKQHTEAHQSSSPSLNSTFFFFVHTVGESLYSASTTTVISPDNPQHVAVRNACDY